MLNDNRYFATIRVVKDSPIKKGSELKNSKKCYYNNHKPHVINIVRIGVSKESKQNNTDNLV